MDSEILSVVDFTLMETIISENLAREWNLEMGFFIIIKEIFMKEISTMIKEYFKYFRHKLIYIY